MQIVDFITEDNAILFLLLFARMSGLIAFFPFFSHLAIPISVKTALAFYLSILFFPVASLANIDYSVGSLSILILSELLLGFIAGLTLHIVFAALQLAGMQIAMVMGFSMASVMDPSSGINAPIISQILVLIAIMMLLAFDGHHMILLFLNKSIGHIELGSFYPQSYIWDYINESIKHMFMMGFILSFPVIAISLLADIIFGMLMKTMPQFNLLVVGFPIKIFLSFMVMIATLGSIMLIFKKDFIEVFNFLNIFG